LGELLSSGLRGHKTPSPCVSPAPSTPESPRGDPTFHKNRPLTPTEQQAALDQFLKARVDPPPPTPPEKGGRSRKSLFGLSIAGSKSSKPFRSDSSGSDIVPPLPHAEELVLFLLHHPDVVSCVLDATLHSEKLVNPMLQILIDNRMEVKFISSYLQEELSITEQESTLFRDNSAGTALFSAFCKQKGASFLEGVLSVTYERLMYRDDALEVDPARCSDTAAINNQALLAQFTNDLLDRVFESRSLFPRSLAAVFSCVREMVEATFPHLRTRILGSFFFLRFLCPMALTPKKYGITDHEPSAGGRRTLILVTKIIQNTSNNVPFTKEKYMIPFNDIVKQRHQEMEEFLLSLTDYESMPDEVSRPRSSSQVLSALQHTPKQSGHVVRAAASEIAANFSLIQTHAEEVNVTEKVEQLESILEKIKKEDPEFGWASKESVSEVEAEPDFEVSREAFLLLREAFSQCEAELREVKIRLEEESTLRRNMQEMVGTLTDSMQTRVKAQVEFKLNIIKERAAERGIDMSFCEDVMPAYSQPLLESDKE